MKNRRVFFSRYLAVNDGADVETVDNGFGTAMVWTSTRGHGGAVRMLLEAGGVP